MTTANDLIVVFLALEVLSIPLYVLAAFDRRRLGRRRRDQVLRARRVLVGRVPLRRRARVRRHRARPPSPGSRSSSPRTRCSSRARCCSASGCSSSGSASRSRRCRSTCGRPDVYQGAPTPVTAFMASATKAAGFAALLRVFTTVVPAVPRRLAPDRVGARRAPLLVGSIAAVVQTDVKRMLAYSSIAHAGYVLMGVYGDAGRPRSRAALPVHLRVHDDRRVRRGHHRHADRRRQARDRRLRGPRLRRCSAVCSMFFVLAQAGIPLTGGFIASRPARSPPDRTRAGRGRGERRGRPGRRGRSGPGRRRRPPPPARGRRKERPSTQGGEGARSPSRCRPGAGRRPRVVAVRRGRDERRESCGYKLTLILGLVPQGGSSTTGRQRRLR